MYSGSPDPHVASHHFDIGMATLRLDGFASLDAGATEATLITKLLDFSAGDLLLNADVEPGGYIRVGLLDSEGNAISGYSLDLSDDVQGDQLRALVTWGDQATLPDSLPGGTRLEFRMVNAKLYSFLITPTAVPEPAASSLLLYGLAGTFLWLRRRGTRR